jgi:hypothetical protein
MLGTGATVGGRTVACEVERRARGPIAVRSSYPMSEYAFGPARTVTIAELRGLDRERQLQALFALGSYVGTSWWDVDACAKELVGRYGVDESFSLDLHEITRAGESEPRFEMWVVFVDNGVVFPFGSSDATSVHCAQSHFWSVDDGDSDAVALARALDQIVPF